VRLFIVDSKASNWGSTRIYRDNLAYFLSNQGVEVQLSNQTHTINRPDSILFGKNSTEKEIHFFKEKYPGALIGIIHPTNDTKSDREKIRLAEYFVVGSLEERDGLLKFGKTILQFPQIENIPLATKKHSTKSELLIGYHGNRMHIENAGPEFWGAIDQIADESCAKLRLIYNIKSVGKAKIETRMPAEHVQWDLKTVWRSLGECDIGLVPGVISLGLGTRLYNTYLDRKSGFNGDYMIRFKSNSNAGRSFVFFQLGIPVVAGLIPSNLHILGNPDCGYIAISQSGWYQGMRALVQSADHRQKVADCAKRAFEREYDPNKWARRFIAGLAGICKTS